MSLFDLDAVAEREKERVPGLKSDNDYYPSIGAEFTGDTQTYKDYESAVRDAKKRVEEANRQAEYIDVLIGLLSGSLSPQEAEKEYGYLSLPKNQQPTVERLVGKLEDRSDYDVKGLEITELQSIKDDIKESFAPDFDLYKALNEEPNIQTVAALVLNKDKPEVISQLVESPETATDFVNPSAAPTAPPAPAPSPQAETLERGLEGLAQARKTGKVFDDQGGAAIISEEMAKRDEAFAGWAGFLGQSVPGTRGTVPAEEIEETEEQPTGTGRSSLMQQRAADRSEIQTLLAEQFGGSAFFFEANQDGLRIGLTADGSPVDVNDPQAVSEISIMDYIVNNGITDQSRVLTLLQKTEWWQDTDNAMRTFDVTWSQLSEPGRIEYLEPVMDVLDQEAQFLGFELSDDRKYILAKDIARMGESQDSDYIRTKLLDELEYESMSNDISGFGAARDSLQQLAYKYYTPLSDEAANDWAELIYTGESTELEYEQFLKQTAVSRFPTLDKIVNEMGITPDQYFQPYKQQIEGMLGRQVNMLDEFSDVIEYIPDGGTSSRPMTLSEVRKFVRGLPEWQMTDDAKDQAKALSYAIGQTFGEVA